MKSIAALKEEKEPELWMPATGEFELQPVRFMELMDTTLTGISSVS